MSLSIKTKPSLSVLRKQRTALVQKYAETDCILKIDFITDLERSERVATLNHIENQLDEINELIRVTERSSQ